jgi:RNAse (barnase) inhibitor barstar
MSGLAAVLAGRHAPGVYRWHAHLTEADVRRAVEHAGWRYGHLDGWQVEDKAEFLSAVGKALSFPDSYGHNFDALSDCLADLGPAALLWDGWSCFDRADEGAFKTAVDVLESHALDERTAPFVVLLRGDGPEVDGLESLD